MAVSTNSAFMKKYYLEQFHRLQMEMALETLKDNHTLGPLRHLKNVNGMLTQQQQETHDAIAEMCSRKPPLDINDYVPIMRAFRFAIPYAPPTQLARWVNRTVLKLTTFYPNTVLEFPFASFRPYTIIQRQRGADIEKYTPLLPLEILSAPKLLQELAPSSKEKRVGMSETSFDDLLLAYQSRDDVSQEARMSAMGEASRRFRRLKDIYHRSLG